MPPEESRHAVLGGRRVDILATQILQDLHVQRTMVPLIRFVEIDRDLYRHGIWHFTRASPIPAAITRTFRSRRILPTSADARAGIPHSACPASSECCQTQDCA